MAVTYDWTYREFLDHVKNTPRSEHSQARGFDYSQKGSANFTQTKGLDHALDLASNGWDAGLQQLDPKDGVAMQGNTYFEPNVHGSMPHVQNYIQGLPLTMYQPVSETEYNRPEVTVVFRIGYSADVDSKKVIRFAKAAAGYINKLQQHNNIQVVGVHCSGNMRSGTMVGRITIKELNERFVLNNLAFAFHPSFFRRLYFKHYETTDELRSSGYGVPSSEEEYIKEAKKLTKGTTHIIPCTESVDAQWDDSKILIINP